MKNLLTALLRGLPSAAFLLKLKHNPVLGRVFNTQPRTEIFARHTPLFGRDQPRAQHSPQQREEDVERLDGGEDFTSPLCRHSFGISTDEPRPGLSSSRRLYVFSPDPWTESAVRSIMLHNGER